MSSDGDGDYPVADGDADSVDMVEGEEDALDSGDSITENEADGDQDTTDTVSQNSLWFRINTSESNQSQVVEVVNPLPADLRIPVAKSFTVEGKVTTSTSEPVTGRIIFEPTKPDNLPPRLRWDTISAQLRQDNGSYQVKLARGGYNVYILPDSYRIPPYIEYRAFSVVDEALTLNYDLKSEADYIQISGVLLHSTPERTVAGLTIKAVNEELGLESSSYEVSSSGSFNFAFPKLDRDEVYLTVEVTGRFTRVTEPGQEKDYVPARTFANAIKLIRIPDENNPGVWGYKQEYYNAAGVQMPNLHLNYDDIPSGLCRVTGTLWSSASPTAACGSNERGTDCSPVTDATLSIRGTLPTGEFKHVISMAAREDGSVSFDVMPGFYSMLIIPAPSQKAATTLTSLDCTAITHGADSGDEFDAALDYTLTERIVVTGIAYSPYNVPLDSAELYATYLSSNETGTTIMYSTLTGGNGEFLLLMDPGNYNVILQPPPEINTAWMVRLNQTLSESGSRNFVLPEGHMVEGDIIFASDGSAAANSSVEISVISPDGTAVQISKGASDEEGHFNLLVDPSFIIQ